MSDFSWGVDYFSWSDTLARKQVSEAVVSSCRLSFPLSAWNVHLMNELEQKQSGPQYV